MLGGFLVGTLWLTISISLTEWLSARGKITWQTWGSYADLYSRLKPYFGTAFHANICRSLSISIVSLSEINF